MGIYNIHAGHAPEGGQGCGAVGIIDESREARKVKNEVIRLLSVNGHTVYDCTCDVSCSQGQCLNHIVNKCNAHKVDYDISIHLNSGRGDYSGDGQTGGVEVLGYDDGVRGIAERVSNQIATALNIRNRGFKTNKNLMVLNSTKSLAMLIECCFVDDKDDVDRWNPLKCAEAIVKGILNTDNINISGKLHYRGHVEEIGWDNVKAADDKNYAGTIGEGRRLEAIKIDYPGHVVKAKTYIQDIGEVDYGVITADTIIGTVGESKMIEWIWLQGEFRFRIHQKDKGWSDWADARNGAALGVKGEGLRIEAIHIASI